MYRWCLAVLLLLDAPSLVAMELFEAPTHLRFSASEVSEAAHDLQPTAEAAISRCDARCARVQRLWARLLPAAREQPGQRGAALRLTLVADAGSAYAHADGNVVFPLTLIDTLALNDEEIAFILAHEMIHVLLEHEREVLTAADGMLRPDVRRTAADIYGTLQFDLGLVLKTSFLMQAAELEADMFGLQLAALAGFDPDLQASALDKLLQSRSSQGAMMPTHPSDADRLQRIRELLPIARAIHRERPRMH